MLPCVCSVIDHRRHQYVVRTSVTHSFIASCANFLFLPHFDVIDDLLLNRRTAIWNLFVKYTHAKHETILKFISWLYKQPAIWFFCTYLVTLYMYYLSFQKVISKIINCKLYQVNVSRHIDALPTYILPYRGFFNAPNNFQYSQFINSYFLFDHLYLD